MKKIIMLVFLSLTLLLSACSPTVDNYNTVEENEDYLYAVYYYDSSNVDNIDYFDEYATEFAANTLFTLNAYDTVNFDASSSKFGAYEGEPVIHIIENGVKIETYTGDEIFDYLFKYSDLDYDDFSSHFATSFNGSLNQTNERYIEYYFSETCSHCRRVKPDVLEMFYNDPGMDFYLYNLSNLSGTVPIGSFVGTPTLYVIENGEIVEQYIGSIEIREYAQSYLQE